MLKGYKDAGTVAAEIKMTRAERDASVLVLEGADDVRFWLPRRHLACELVDAEGKKNVIGAIKQKLSAADLAGVLGVVDDDYDSIESLVLDSKNIVATDAHDLECVLCRSSALDTVLAEFGNPAKIQRFEHREGVDVRIGLLDRALIFGRIRWVAMRHPRSVDLDPLRVRRFVDERSWSIKDAELIRQVDRESLDGSALSRRIVSLPPTDPWYVVHGDDLIELLRIGLLRVLGDLRATTGAKEISRVLRAAISNSELKDTIFGASIQAWENRNNPYAVFPVDGRRPLGNMDPLG